MKEFVDLVAKMRNAQTSYFRARKSGDNVQSGISLTESKRLEKQVDDFISQYISGASQSKLF